MQKITDKVAPLNHKESSELKEINKANQDKPTFVNANDASKEELVCETKTVDKAEDQPVFSAVKIPACSSQKSDKNLSDSEDPSESKFCTDNSKSEINSSPNLPTEPCQTSTENQDKIVSMTSKPAVRPEMVLLNIVDMSGKKRWFKISKKQKLAKYVYVY